MTEHGENTASWEDAYLRFRTPEQEDHQFRSSLTAAGADGWSREGVILELFCGRGGALRSLCAMGFRNVEGVDLSKELLKEYSGPATVYESDCRELPFGDNEKDVVIARDGLHHLPEFPRDLDRTFTEIRRVLKPGGRIAVWEPWPTPYLHLLHAVSRIVPLRKCWPRLDAFATMVEIERPVYYQWLSHPAEILDMLRSRFEEESCTIGKGQLVFIGRKKI